MADRLRLLVVEDEENDAELIRLELTRGGFDVDMTRVDDEASLRDALARSTWDIVLSDFAMPAFNGVRAFEVVRETGLDLPFIFVSGALGEERAVEAMRAGAKDYFLKGHLGRLAGAVRRELIDAKNRRDLRAADEYLRHHQRRLAMAVEASGGAVFEYWGANQSHFSATWETILGYAREDFPAREQFWSWLAERAHPDDAAGLEKARAALLDGSKPQLRAPFRLRHKDERWIDVELCAQLFESGQKAEPPHLVGALRDLTDRRQLEDQLRHAQRMEAVGQLASGVAHDFNNLLTVILSYSQMGMDELGVEHSFHGKLGLILKAAHKAERLTGQLLAFSRKKPITPRVLCLNESVRDIDKMLGRLLGADIKVELHLATDLWNVRIDSGAFEQVLMNLAVNARDAMPKGGKLTIETNNVRLEDAFGAGHEIAFSPGDYVVLAVTDTGCGMDRETCARVFEPFFTTKDIGKGTGLGLSTCYGIVKQAEGYIWVYSEPGLGTTFKVYLPRVSKATETAVTVEAPRQLGGNETILVAEDDALLRDLVSLVLKTRGYTVIEAANAEEAIQKSESIAGEIDLLLTDVVMPGIQGPQLGSKLRDAKPDLKIILMSGYAPAGAPLHEFPLLQKPFTPASLCERVRQELDSKG